MANFFVPKNDHFTVTIPLDCTDPENPQVVFAEGLEGYPAALQKIPEEALAYHWMKWRKPAWGMDCFLRELAYIGGSTRERQFSQEQFDAVRIRYLLLDSSFFPEKDRVSFTKAGSYEVLSGPSEELVNSLQPVLLRIFLGVASRIWDLGSASKNLLQADDYVMLRNLPDGLLQVSRAKGLISSPDDEKKKVTSTTASVRPATPKPTPETPTGADSSTVPPESSGKTSV